MSIGNFQVFVAINMKKKNIFYMIIFNDSVYILWFNHMRFCEEWVYKFVL